MMESTQKRIKALSEELCRELGLPIEMASKVIGLFIEEPKMGQAKPLDGDLYPVAGFRMKGMKGRSQLLEDY